METQKQGTPKSNLPVQNADGVEVTFYTDPLCCWSWAMMPAWERLISQDAPGVKVVFKMRGLLPPESSYPACIAVKCAQLQSQKYGETLLHLLWEAAMVGGKNTARNGVLLDAAWVLHDEYRDFDLFRFRDDLMGDTGKEAFRRDLQEVKYLGINRSPTLVIRRNNGSSVMLTGYQTYGALKTGMGIPDETLS